MDKWRHINLMQKLKVLQVLHVQILPYMQSPFESGAEHGLTSAIWMKSLEWELKKTNQHGLSENHSCMFQIRSKVYSI